MFFLIKANYIIIVFLLLLLSVQDVLFRKIENRIVFILMILCISLSLLYGTMPNIVLSGIIIISGFALSLLNVIGAGDVKLIAALSLLYSQPFFYYFLFLVALFGGLIAIYYLIFLNRSAKVNGIPYGVAISLGFIFSYPIN